MPEIDVSEDQLAYLEDLRATLETEVPYGHVRHRDALQYLIDRREDEVDADLRDALADGDEATATETPAEEETEPATDSAADSSGPDAETGGDSGADTPTETATEAATETASTSTPTPTPTSASGDDRLQAMMSLLDTHDEHWRESAAEDARYEVTLPDGRVEHARTKDDVRSLLFKHYR